MPNQHAHKRWIGKYSDYAWPEHPVIDIDFSQLAFATPEEFVTSLSRNLELIGNGYDIDITNESLLVLKLKVLIEELAKKNKVVVLIDEYDAPLLNNLDNLKIATSIQKVMKSFFSALKSYDRQGLIHVVFVTGVTKFAKTSIFSGMNNLDDLTTMPEACTLLGYTTEELTHYFSEYITEFADEEKIPAQEMFEKIKQLYNGYRFARNEIKVYNPYSVLNALRDHYLKNYWLTTGTSAFIIKLLNDQYDEIKDFQTTEISDESLSTFEIGELPIIPILFQAGYLTISGYDKTTQNYMLDYPNDEVRRSFKQYILIALTKRDLRHVQTALSQFKKALDSNDIDLKQNFSF